MSKQQGKLFFNRRKLFYVERAEKKILATMVGQRPKINKKHWRRPKAVPKKRHLDQNRNDSKSHIRNSFLEYIVWGRQFLSTRSSEHHQSFFFNFRFSSRKSKSQQKLAKKIIHFTIQFLSKNLTHFMKLNSLDT